MDPGGKRVNGEGAWGAAFRVGEWTVEPSLNRVTRGNQSVHVRRQLIDLLRLLASRQGQVVSKEEIFKAVWPGQFVAETGLARCISQLRDVFEDDAREPRVIETIPTRGYRLVAPVGPVQDIKPEAETTAAPPGSTSPAVPGAGAEPVLPALPAGDVEAKDRSNAASPPPRTHPETRPWLFPAAGILLLLAIGGAALVWRSLDEPVQLSGNDTLLVSFSNRTGEAVFDDTLRLALAIQLEQSPYLRVVSEERVRDALRLMKRTPEEAETGTIAMELCQRVGARLALKGTISSLGARYVIGLEGLECPSGRTVARRQVEAGRKEDVMSSLGQAVSDMRTRLGESVATARPPEVPLAQATTSSLEALKELTAGDLARSGGRDGDAIAAYERAIELDPEFALAYGRLGVHLLSLTRTGEAIAALRRAYQLRDRTSPAERQYITAHYYSRVIRDPAKAIAALEAWRDVYPKHASARISLGESYLQAGRFEEALAEGREALVLEPGDQTATYIVVDALSSLERFDEAKKLAEAEIAAGRGNATTRSTLLLIAFARDDEEGVREQLEWAAANPAAEPLFAVVRAAIAMFGGRMHEGDQLRRQRVEQAEARGDGTVAALTAAGAAVHEALVGRVEEVRSLTAFASKDPRTPDTLLRSAFALALAGETGQAERLFANYLRLPDVEPGSDPQYRAPTEALIETARGRQARAVEILAPLASHGLGLAAVPVYVRGLAYMSAGRPREAAAEFASITGHRGALGVSLTYPLAWLQLARARTAAGDLTGAREAYERFLHLWKDADHDLPALAAARAELSALPPPLTP